MELKKQSVEFIYPATQEDWIREMKKIEIAYRTCYKSEQKITEDSYSEFIKSHINHESPLEHCSATVIANISRGIQQEWTRHRIAAYSIESTRYIDYAKKVPEITCIYPAIWNDMTPEQKEAYTQAMKDSEMHYYKLRDLGLKPQHARDALPLGLSSRCVITHNFRTWRHIFKERALNKGAHPDIREIMNVIFDEFVKNAEPVFGDLYDHGKLT